MLIRMAEQSWRLALPQYLLRHRQYLRLSRLRDLSNCRHQSTRVRRAIWRYPIPLPPLPEQRRIVAEIEKQFTRLDAGVAALKRVQANLKRYRASVLKAACEGRLAPQDPADEPADRLLARILAERRAKWEAEHPGKKYVEPAAPVTDGLPELPVGWCWATRRSKFRRRCESHRAMDESVAARRPLVFQC